MRARAAGQLPTPKVHCTVFEDNSSALELACLPKIYPQTKHINQSFLHFCEHVECQDVIIKATPSDKEMAESSTNPSLKLPLFAITRQSWDGRQHVSRRKGVFKSLQNQISDGWPPACHP